MDAVVIRGPTSSREVDEAMRRFILKLMRRRRLERDLEAELSFHREMSATAGNPIPLGNTTVIREHAFDLWRFTFVENLWRDLIYAMRSLRKSPALVFSALLSLALGIGANAAIFSLGVEFLLSEPSVRDPASLVSVRIGGSSHAKPHVVDFIRESGVFQDVVGHREEAFVNWNDGAETRRIFGMFTTNNYFTALGIPVEQGRGIIPSDPNEVVVLHNRFWRRHFNGDPSVVGRVIQLDGRPYTVVGILPANHRTLVGFGFSPDVYLPHYLDDTLLAMYARLKPGMSIVEARSGVELAAKRLDSVFPERWKYAQGCEVKAAAGLAHMQQERKMQTLGLFFVVLLILVGLVLLIACVNVASLLLARASARSREIAIRLALGAGRGRLVQQLLVESLLLSVLGAACGLALSHTVATMLARVHLPLPIPIRLQIEPDWRVVVYAALLTLFATVAGGMLPAWQSVRASLVQFQRERRLRLRRALVAAQVAVCVIVLTTGFLFLRNLFKANAISPGFDVRRTLRADVHLPPAFSKEPRRVALYIDQALRSLEALPGIEAAAAARIIPFTDATRYGSRLMFPDGGEQVQAMFHWNAVTSAYFRAMDISVLQGRVFSAVDGRGTKVVIVNREFVSRYLGSKQPIGTIFLWGAEGKTPYQIVGVVEGTKNMTIGEGDLPQLYEPLAQSEKQRPRIQFVMRSALPPVTQLGPVKRALRAVEPGAGTEVATLFSSIGLAFLPSQVGALFLGSVGFLGLLLAAIGVYGVMVYSVASRTREIGVRTALGASRTQIGAMVLREAMVLVVAGSAVGLFVAWFVTKPLTLFLVPGLEPGDSVSFVAVALVLCVTGLLATWGPIRRALSTEPLRALRYD